MVGLITNIGQSFGYAFKNTLFRPLLWIGLIIVGFFTFLCLAVGLLCVLDVISGGELIGKELDIGFNLLYIGIPLLVIGILLGFFFNGIQVQIFANKNITFRGFFKSIGRGFQLFVINFIYSLIIGIILGICFACGVFGSSTEGLMTLLSQIAMGSTDLMPTIMTTFFANGVTAVGVIMLIILILLFLFFAILMLAADVNFARAGKFGAAFHFGEIFKRIGFLGIIKFILAIIIFAILAIVIMIVAGLIYGLISMIPVDVVKIIIAILFTIVIAPFLMVFCVKYFSNLFAD